MINICCACGKEFRNFETPVYIRWNSHPLCENCYKRISAYNQLSALLRTGDADPKVFANAYIDTHEAIDQSGFAGNIVSGLQQDLDLTVEDYYNRHPGFQEAVENSPAFTGKPDTIVTKKSQNIEMAAANDGSKTELGMKWFKFIIYVQLFLTALIYVYNALLFLTGIVYGDVRDAVYATFPLIKIANCLYAICSLGLACLSVYVRQELAHYKRNAPKKYYLLLFLSIAVTWIYVIIGASILGPDGGPYVTLENVSNTISLIIYYMINRTYFKHRAHLFVN